MTEFKEVLSAISSLINDCKNKEEMVDLIDQSGCLDLFLTEVSILTLSPLDSKEVYVLENVYFEKDKNIVMVHMSPLARDIASGKPSDQVIVNRNITEVTLFPQGPNRTMPKVSMVYAATKSGVIGKDNTLPWNIPSDLKGFRELTTNRAVIMGRKTHESIGKPLPNRINIVLSRDLNYKAEGCWVIDSLDDALEYLAWLRVEHAMVIGGAEIYKIAEPIADEIVRTIVTTDYEGDTVYNPDLYSFRLDKTVAFIGDRRDSSNYVKEIWTRR